MLDELKERYKSLRPSTKYALLVVLGLVPAAWTYYDQGMGLQEQLSEANTAKETANQQYQAAKKKTEDLPKLEAKFTFVTEELRKAQEKLPNKFFMDDILYSTANAAKESGIDLVSFKPGDEKIVQGAHQYMEMPVKLSISGRYSQVVNFFDTIVHLKKIVHIRNITMNAQRKANAGGKGSTVTIKSAVDLIVFRSV